MNMKVLAKHRGSCNKKNHKIFSSNIRDKGLKCSTLNILYLKVIHMR